MWKQKLLKYSKSEFAFVSNPNDNSQIYHYDGIVFDTYICFDINVDYLLSALQVERKLDKEHQFAEVELNTQGYELFYGKEECFYTHYSPSELQPYYDNLHPVLITPFPLVPAKLTVIDGNHRVCKQILEKKTTIGAYYVLDGAICLSLMTQFQICLYCFLFDVSRIIYNTGKISDGNIRNGLYIFNSNSSMHIALNR